MILYDAGIHMKKSAFLQYVIAVAAVLNTGLLLLFLFIGISVAKDDAQPVPINQEVLMEQAPVEQKPSESLRVEDVEGETGQRFVLEEEGIFEVKKMDSNYGQDGVLKSLRLPSIALGRTTNFAWDQRMYKEIALSPNGKWLLMRGYAWEAGFWQVASVRDLGWTTTLNIEFDNETLAVDSIEWLPDNRLRVHEGCDPEPEHPELSPEYLSICTRESVSANAPWELKLVSKVKREVAAESVRWRVTAGADTDSEQNIAVDVTFVDGTVKSYDLGKERGCSESNVPSGSEIGRMNCYYALSGTAFIAYTDSGRLIIARDRESAKDGSVSRTVFHVL